MVEIIVVTAIVAASILAALAVAQKAIYVARSSLHLSQAAYLLEEGAENTKILRDNDWSNIANFSTTSESIGIFTRSTSLANVYRDVNEDIALSGTLDPGTKLVTVSVSWPEGGNAVTKTLLFYITDIFS